MSRLYWALVGLSSVPGSLQVAQCIFSYITSMAPDFCEQRATGHFFVARTEAGGRQSQRGGSHGLNSEQFTTRKLMSLGFRPARPQDAGSVKGRQQGYWINEHASDHWETSGLTREKAWP